MIDRLRRLWEKFQPSGDTTQKTIQSAMWVLSMNGSDRALQLVMMVFLASLLEPSDFGLYGISLLGLNALKRVSRLGLSQALIYEKEQNVDAYLDTAMTLRIIRGVIIAVGLYFAAPTIATLLNEPRATTFIRVIGLSPLLTSFHNPGVVYFQKDLNFHKQFLYSVSGSVTRFVVGIGLGLLYQNVWALVIGFLSADVGRLIASYIAHEHTPIPSLDFDRAREMIDYGKWVTGDSLVHFLYSEGDDIIVAWLLGSATLGFYQLAYRLSNAPSTELSQVIRSVTFPAFSKIQDNTAALRGSFFQTLRITTLVSFPLAVGIAAVAPVFVKTFMGTKWLPAVPVMQILAAHGLILSITTSYGSVWQAIGRPDYATKVGAVRVLLMAVLIIPVTQEFGIVGTAALVVLILVVPLFELETYLLINSLDTTWRRMVSELLYPAVASGVMGVVVVYAERTFSPKPLILEFVSLVLLGAVVYGTLVIVLEFQFNWGLEREYQTVTSALLD